MAEEMKRMRAQMEEDEQVASLMRGLRGQNLSDSQFAADDVVMRLVEVDFFSPYYTLCNSVVSMLVDCGGMPQIVFTCPLAISAGELTMLHS